jgi:hypothetical protein
VGMSTPRGQREIKGEKWRTYEAVVLVYDDGVVPVPPDTLPIDMRDGGYAEVWTEGEGPEEGEEVGCGVAEGHGWWGGRGGG